MESGRTTLVHTPILYLLTYQHLSSQSLSSRPGPPMSHPCSYLRQMHKLPLTPSTSLQQSSCSLFSHQVFTISWIVPIRIQTCCNFSCLKLFCTSQDMARILATLQEALKKMSPWHLQKNVFTCFSSNYSPIHSQAHMIAAFTLLLHWSCCQGPKWLHFNNFTSSCLMYILHCCLWNQTWLFWISPLLPLFSHSRALFSFFLLSSPSWLGSAPRFSFWSSLLYLYSLSWWFWLEVLGVILNASVSLSWMIQKSLDSTFKIYS